MVNLSHLALVPRPSANLLVGRGARMMMPIRRAQVRGKILGSPLKAPHRQLQVRAHSSQIGSQRAPHSFHEHAENGRLPVHILPIRPLVQRCYHALA